MTRKGKNKNKKGHTESVTPKPPPPQPPEKVEVKPSVSAAVPKPTVTPTNSKTSPKREVNNNPKTSVKEPPRIDDDGEEAQWCPHLEESSPEAFQRLIRRPLNCVTCLKKAQITCIHRDCIKNPVANSCRNIKHLFSHMMQQKHPAFLHMQLKVILCTRCNIRCSLRQFLHHFNLPADFIDQPAPKPKREIKLRGITGYLNFGNTCYMNAVLQFLGHCPSFADYLIKLVPPGGWEKCSPDIPKTVIQMALDLRGIHSSVKLPFSSPWKIISCVRNELPGFECFQQQDASEFLRNLLDILDRDLKACSEYFDNNRPIGYGNPELDYDIAMDCRTTKTAITAMFQGVLENQIRCHSCGFRSRTTENFLDISIPIISENEFEDNYIDSSKKDVPPQETPELSNESDSDPDGEDPGYVVHRRLAHKTRLDACLDMFFQNETLNGDNQYSCSRCECLVDATKTTKAQRLPEYILIQLKRFRHTVFGSCKIGKTVEFPLRKQNFGRYTTSGEPQYYELVGFIVHEGRTVEFGHYVTICKHEQDNLWYKFDDVAVTRLDATHAAKSEPYILMYRRIPNKTDAPQPKGVTPYNFFSSKRFFTDKRSEAWHIIEKYLEQVPDEVPEPPKEKTEKIIAKKVTMANTEESMVKKRRRKVLLKQKHLEVLAMSDIPLDQIRAHVSNLERILKDIQKSQAAMKASDQPVSRRSLNKTLQAANELVASIEKWFKVIIKKEWLEQVKLAAQLQRRTKKKTAVKKQQVNNTKKIETTNMGPHANGVKPYLI